MRDGIAGEPLALVGMGREGQHAVGQEVPGRLVPRHEERHAEHEEVELLELLAVDARVDERRDHVVGRDARAARRRPPRSSPAAPSRAACSRGLLVAASMTPSDQVRKRARSSPGTPSMSAITSNGRWTAKLVDEIDRPARLRTTEHLVQQAARGRRGSATCQRTQAAGAEGGLDQLAVLPVLRRVDEDDRLARQHLPSDVGDEHAAARAERGGVARDREHVLVTRHGPEAGRVVPVHRGLRAQAAEGGKRIAGMERRIVQRWRKLGRVGGVHR